MDEAENQINNLEHKEEKQSDQQEEKRIPKNKNNVSIIWDNFKLSNICIIDVAEGEERSKKLEIYLKK